jgi:hypothetical protein
MMMKVDFIEIRLSKGLYYPSPAVTSGRSGGKLVFDCPILATEAPVLSQLLHAQTDGDFPPPSLVPEAPRSLNLVAEICASQCAVITPAPLPARCTAQFNQELLCEFIPKQVRE